MEVQVKRAFKSYYISSFVCKKNNTKVDRMWIARSVILKSAPFYFPLFSKTISQVPGQDQQQQNGIYSS